jgi:arylsulfatase A-like enzyme
VTSSVASGVPAAAISTPNPERRSRLLRAADEILAGSAAAVVGAALFLVLVRLIPIPFSVHDWDFRSAGLVWRTPWGYLIVFAPLALLLAVFSALLPRGVPLRLTVTLWGTLVLWGLVLRITQVHGLAWLVLALAVSLPLGKAAARRPRAVRGAMRWGGATLLAVALALRPLFERQQAARERNALAALPAAASGAPNVLLIIWDTARAASLSLYGAPFRTTPVLDSLARHGATFDEAYSTSSWTLPSHASMFTGAYASETETDFAAALPAGRPTLAELLRDRGYATGGFTANLMATRAESGLARGFARYEDFVPSLREILHSTPYTQADIAVVLLELVHSGNYRRIWPELKRASFETNFTVNSHEVKRTPQVAADFLAWQGSLPAGRPYFAFLNFFDAHDPYRPPPEDLAAVGDTARSTLARYHGALHYVDRHMGTMLQELARRGGLENTIVIVTSDHGEQFGEHGLTLHGNSLYRQALHVPFVLVFPPRVAAGVRVAQPVTLRDLPATVLELAGISSAATGIGGASLAAAITAPAASASAPAPGSVVLSELTQHYRRSPKLRNLNGPMQSVVADSLHVIRDGDGEVEGYNVITDGAELVNLAEGARRDSLAALLDAGVAHTQVKLPSSRARPRAEPPTRRK